MSDTPAPGWIITTAGAIVGALWMALRGAVAKNEARLEADLKSARERIADLERAEKYWQRQAFFYASELKDAADRKRGRDDTPREELPTFTAIMDLRAGDPVAADHAARQRGIDAILQEGLRSDPPLAGVIPRAPRT